MAIEGRITYDFPITLPMPPGIMCVIAEDGSHHVLCRTGFDEFVNIAHCEALDRDGSAISEATWRGHVEDQLGVVDGSIGSEVVAAFMRMSGPRTSKVVILGQSKVVGMLFYQVLGIVYTLNAPGNIVYAHKLHYYQENNLSPEGFLGGTYGGAVGQVVIGNNLYFIADYGTFFAGRKSQLTVLPLNADEVVLTENSWAAKRYNLPGPDFNTQLWWTGTIGASLWEHPDGIGILAYLSPKLWFTVVSTAAGAPGANTGQNDISAAFGIPFPDEGKNFAGVPTVFASDLYTTPSVHVLPGGRLELMFMRGASDVPGKIGFRRAVCNADLSGPVMSDLVWLDLTNEAGITLEAVHNYREGDDVIFMIKEDAALTFKQITLQAIKRRFVHNRMVG